jgi:hypothetical protein
MNTENIKLSEIMSHRRTNTSWLNSYEAPKIINVIETESGRVVSRGLE